MAYQDVDLETKMSIVQEYQSGEKITKIAKKYGVSRQSIYNWRDDAIEAMKKALVPYKTDEVKLLQERINQLEKEIELLSNKYNKLTQETQVEVTSTPSLEPRPTNCPECSSSSVIKNGTYQTKAGTKQRFRCKDCDNRTYLVKKNNK